MICFTKYAEQKFDILHKYKLFYTREQIENVLANPEKAGKKNRHLTAEQDGIKVIYRKEGNVKKVITFYPIK